MDRFYSFRVVTYNTEEKCFQPLLEKTFKNAWILHDKDKTDPHIHILCTFKQNKSFKQVREMVEGEQNTFVQQMKDKYQDFLYLTHSEDFPDKALYNESDIHCNDLTFFQRGAKKSVDNEEFIVDLLDKNMTYKQKAIKYGRDYIRNFRVYEKFVKMLRYEENIMQRIENGELVEDLNNFDPFEIHTQYQIDPETGEIIDQKKSP